MYEVDAYIDTDYTAAYIYKAKNSVGQILCAEIAFITDGYFWMKFYITTKRRDGYQEGKTTGKDGIRGLIWAKRCLEDWLTNYGHKHHGEKLLIQGADKRRYNVYKRSLEPLGFREILDGTRTFMIEL